MLLLAKVIRERRNGFKCLTISINDSDARKSIGTELVENYDSIHGVIEVNNEEVGIERRLKEPGYKGKVIMNDQIFLC